MRLVFVLFIEPRGTYNNKKEIFMTIRPVATIKTGTRSGQAMLIAVLSLGGVILGATTIAGLLTLYQLRASNDAEHSAQALFAADSGVEWTLFSYYCGIDSPSRCLNGPPPPPTFAADGATVTSTCYEADGVTVSDCSNTTTTASAISVGASAGTRRAFAVSLQGSTSTDP